MEVALPVETAEERRQKQMEGVPDLPPLLAQILAETRAKQQRVKDRAASGVPPDEAEEASKGGAAKPGGPLLLEGPSSFLVVATNDAPIPKELSDSEDIDSEAEPDAPPGPPDAARCRAHGPGFSGAAAGQAVKLTITCRDAANKRVHEGGAHILVMVEPPAVPGRADGEEPEAIQAEVEDHGNGTYTASYTVPTKGNYQLHIEVDGEPLGGSPFPIFFSAPVPQAPAGAAAAAAPVDPAQAAAQQQQAAAGAALAGVLAGAEAAAMGLPPAPVGPMAALQSTLGFQLAQVGLKFPPTLSEDDARRIVVVGSVPNGTEGDALKVVFKPCGTIRSITMAPGATSSFAFVDFTRSKYAAAALAMEKPEINGQALKLELAQVARKNSEAAVPILAQMGNPYMQMQMAQRQQFQLLQQQQTALAQQVATMRAAQRAGTAAQSAPAQPHSNDSQKSAAMAAAIALSKKLAAGAGAAAGAATGAPAPAPNGSERKSSRSRERSRDRSRRERLPSRSRSRSKDRRRERRRSRSRDRRSSRERRSGRDRDGSRERRRRRSRSGDRHKDKHRHHKKDRRRSRDRKERSDRGDKEEAPAEKMDVEVAPAGEDTKAQPADELEALLEELGD